MFLLLSGTGVGISVQHHHIEKLPEIRKPTKDTKYVIGDSIEGWSSAVNYLMKSYFTGKNKPRFVYDDIRAKGAPLITSGGKAPGPEPLRICLVKIESILSQKKDGTKLTSLEVHDIVCLLADAVLAGGIRRAALISLFSFNDMSMRSCKHGDWWELNPQRGRANNSAVMMRSKITSEEFYEYWEDIKNSGSGEPGIFFSNDKDIGTNPCAEISLKPYSFCNLVEVNASNIISQEDLENRVKLATFIATLQASYTDFHFLRPEWRKQTEKEALVGVSLTGISDGEVLKYDLTKASNVAKNENERVADIIGINKSYRVTTVKPSGNSSVVLSSSSGVHARHSKFYWRRMRIGKNETIYNYLVSVAPQLIEDDKMNQDQAIVKIAVKSPEKSIFRNESALHFLERVKKVFLEWVKPGHRKGANYNNVSATCSIRDNEWEEVGEWMWNNKENYTGISVLPYDGGTYVQAPYEECSEDEYEHFMEHIQGLKLDFTKIIEHEDVTDLKGELACSSGGCTVI